MTMLEDAPHGPDDFVALPLQVAKELIPICE